ncbi:hypothetical protein ASPWEDRAFT_69133 [Aspergillus wentii DTO 134E9]|uniref:Uncharacterized protein n=1 Tax=Aspergillus wentii DTO 134E9 TaxID=1073089 RepID=A0A1L9RLP0_ASPWE|nr:uncharacterized protein ASPWEDRAFT_69133 [Aspergillus wentii DTO 134E9]OJJ35859.1 hypothetical protein ASPWEDRAFT_69133 [Aspergillus wentii DTO 134E9]
MLDEEHESLPCAPGDDILYTLGSIGGHNVVLVCLPAGEVGTSSAATVAMRMKSIFPSIQFGLMVGIGGGVPTASSDVRLGDVVVSQPVSHHGGVVQYDMGKTTPDGFVRTGYLNRPPALLLSALSNVQARHFRGKSTLASHLNLFDDIPEFSRDEAGADLLFQPAYHHVNGGYTSTCQSCHTDQLIPRTPRKKQPVRVHYGTIASGNQVMRDGVTREHISTQLGGILCFEMEAAGLMNSFPCLVIRGICDYADSHKDKRWQPYAASTAAAYAREILSVIPVHSVAKRTAHEGGDSDARRGEEAKLNCHHKPAPDVAFSGTNNSKMQIGMNYGTISGFSIS